MNRLPDPDDLDRHCQLAPIALLEMAIEITVNALATVHPELWLEDEHGPLEVPVQVDRLLAQAVRLRRAIARYRAMLEERDAQETKSATPDDDMPF